MNEFDFELGVEPKNEYDKAKWYINKALNSISKLSAHQQQQLAREMLDEEKYRLLLSLFQRGI